MTFLGLACIWSAGFVSLSHESGAAPGIVLTKAVDVPAGAAIRVNFATKAGGTLRVALVDSVTGLPHAGRSAKECVPLHGDSTDTRVTWTSASTFDHRPRTKASAHLQFHMEGTVELYSYAIE